jgi:hypothetical protein
MAVALVGCGSHESPKVATAQAPTVAASGGTTVAASPTARNSDYDKAVRYTRCMTAHGAVTPDPVEGKMLVTFNTGQGEEPAGLMQAKCEAHQKCKQFLPTTWPVKVKIDPKQAARSRPFDDCMRKNGFPPLTPDANGMIHYPADIMQQFTQKYNVASDAWRHLYDDPANHQ